MNGASFLSTTQKRLIIEFFHYFETIKFNVAKEVHSNHNALRQMFDLYCLRQLFTLV